MNEGAEVISRAQLDRFCAHLDEAGYAKATQTKYKADLAQYIEFLGEGSVDGESCRQYRDYLKHQYKPSSANSKIAALNAFFRFMEWAVQMEPMEPDDRIPAMGGELTMTEYRRLLKEARREGDMRLYYLMQIWSMTKISVSEHRYVTAEAVARGYMVIPRGRKSRVVFIPDRLKKELMSYCRKAGIRGGSLFVNWNKTPLDRSNIHKYLKRLSRSAGVDPAKVNPRSLTHVVEYSSAVCILDAKITDL